MTPRVMQCRIALHVFVSVCVCVQMRACTPHMCERDIDHRREKDGPPKEEWSDEARRPATSRKDRARMMMAPSNLMGYMRRWVRVEEKRTEGAAGGGGGGTLSCGG